MNDITFDVNNVISQQIFDVYEDIQAITIACQKSTIFVSLYG